jgi:L-2-hydroxyglutarate oxidase
LEHVFYDYAIIGGGIVGLSVGVALTERTPSARLLLIEKEPGWARHQTGRNSGVIHSGIYYKPGSLKARFAVEGNRVMVEFCREHGIAHEICGKVIVATASEELPLLENLYSRGLANGLSVSKITLEELKEIEPHVRGLAAIRVPSTGIADYKRVAATFAEILRQRGAELRLGTTLRRIVHRNGSVILETSAGEFESKFLINCAGLHSDRVAILGGADPCARIVPFRGEYYELKPERRHLVKHLIYPVPNPNFPFLGVHFTRMIDGNIHCGPNAVLSFKREGYHKSDFDWRDFAEVMRYRGFWRMASKNWREGLKELHRSFSKATFVRSLQRLIPEIQADDLVPSHAGVRAQALKLDGGMVDDFLIVRGQNSVHVCNAPSPAATASIPIGRAVADQI